MKIHPVHDLVMEIIVARVRTPAQGLLYTRLRAKAA